MLIIVFSLFNRDVQDVQYCHLSLRQHLTDLTPRFYCLSNEFLKWVKYIVLQNMFYLLKIMKIYIYLCFPWL